MVAFSLLAMLWLTQSLRFVEMVTNKGLPLHLFVELTSFLMPRLFSILAPIALFAAVMFVYNRMLSDRELVIMQAAGISPLKNAVAALLSGVILAVFCFYVLNSLIPAAENAFRNLEWEIRNNVSHLMFREGEFTTLPNGMTVFVARHESDGAVSGILLHDERAVGKKVTLSAEKGRIVYTPKGPRIILVHGVRQEVSTEEHHFSSLKFERYSVDMTSSGGHAIKKASVREKTLLELLNASADPSLDEEEKRKYVVEGHHRLISPWYNLAFSLLACTGLLVGAFNRRGQTKIISWSVFLMIVIQGSDLILTNLSARSLHFLPLLYLNCLLPIMICLACLRWYHLGMFSRKYRGESLNA